MSSEKERKTKLSDKQRAIIDIVVTAVEALVVVFCIVVSVLVWVGASDPSNRSFNWFAIQTDSMMGDNKDSLDPGDLMFAKKVGSINDLHATEYDANGNVTKLGDVVAFKQKNAQGYEEIVTHRIVAINYAGNQITTKGDNAAGEDTKLKSFEDIIGVYTGKWKGVGKLTLWLGGYKKVTYDASKELGGYGYEKSGSNMAFLVIIIPLALLFVYNGFVVVKWTMDERAKKIRAAALAEAEKNNVSQEDVKRAALSEYMRANGMTDEQIAAYFAEQDAKAAEAVAKDDVDTTATAEDAAETSEGEQPAESADEAPTDAEDK